jgi:hypothetical protein
MTNDYWILSSQKWSEATTQASLHSRRVSAAAFFLAVSGSSGWRRERFIFGCPFAIAILY